MISKAKGGGILCAYDVIAYKKSHPVVRALREVGERPAIHGTKIWNSSWVIMDYLERKGLTQGAKVLDVGCGWGLTGVYCARGHGARVTAIDADPHVFPFVDLHARTNEVRIKTKVARYEDLRPASFRGVELVAGADICFWDELVDPLYSMVCRAVDAGVPRVLIADPGREPFEHLAERCRKEFKTRVLHRVLKTPAVAGDLLIIKGRK